MAKSQNGWTVQSSTANLWPNPYVGGILAGPVWVVLSYFVLEFNRKVEPVDRSQSGCYNLRKIAGSRKWSNHASATAVDLNWNKHPAGRRGTFAWNGDVVAELVGHFHGVIRWGRLFADEMHFEIAPGITLAQVERLAVELLQVELNQHGYKLAHRRPPRPQDDRGAQGLPGCPQAHPRRHRRTQDLGRPHQLGDTMDPVITIATAPAVLGLVTIAKDLGLPTRLAGVLALILGLALAGLDALLAIYTAFSWVSSGLILGLAAAGVYDTAKLAKGQKDAA